MAKNRDSFYFETFTACAEISCQAGHMLVGILRDFRPEKLEEYLDEMHKIENSADMKKHDMLDRLAKEFIPPIEREDIIALSQRIDDITDKIEDVLFKGRNNADKFFRKTCADNRTRMSVSCG